MGLLYFIKRLLIFSLILGVVYILLIVITGEILSFLPNKNLHYKESKGKLGWRLKEIEEGNKNVDILILGSSRAYRHYDPRIFETNGYEIFILGSSGQTFIETEFLLKRYLERIDSKIVILDIDPGMFREDNLEPHLDMISHSSYRYSSSITLAGNLGPKSINTFIYSGYKNMFEDNIFMEVNGDVSNTYIKGGYIENKGLEYIDRYDKSYNIILNEDQINSFNNVISMLKKYDRKIILVQSPIHQDIEILNYSNFESLVRNVGFKFLNFKNFSATLDKTYFSDAYHLNQNGVDYFNKKLIHKLRINRAAY